MPDCRFNSDHRDDLVPVIPKLFDHVLPPIIYNSSARMNPPANVIQVPLNDDDLSTDASSITFPAPPELYPGRILYPSGLKEAAAAVAAFGGETGPPVEPAAMVVNDNKNPLVPLKEIDEDRVSDIESSDDHIVMMKASSTDQKMQVAVNNNSEVSTNDLVVATADASLSKESPNDDPNKERNDKAKMSTTPQAIDDEPVQPLPMPELQYFKSDLAVRNSHTTTSSSHHHHHTEEDTSPIVEISFAPKNDNKKKSRSGPPTHTSTPAAPNGDSLESLCSVISAITLPDALECNKRDSLLRFQHSNTINTKSKSPCSFFTNATLPKAITTPPRMPMRKGSQTSLLSQQSRTTNQQERQHASVAVAEASSSMLPTLRPLPRPPPPPTPSTNIVGSTNDTSPKIPERRKATSNRQQKKTTSTKQVVTKTIRSFFGTMCSNSGCSSSTTSSTNHHHERPASSLSFHDYRPTFPLRRTSVASAS